jgi:LysM repeat protein
MKSAFKLIPFIILTLDVLPRVTPQDCSQQYIVVSGDTCNGIGAGFNVTGEAIISANPSIDPGCTNLQGGQSLCIPGGSCPLEYTVERNDTCNIIAAKFNVTGSAIIAANPTVSYGCDDLPVGQALCIRNEICIQWYIVASGDSCNVIGGKFDVTGSDIISANPTINVGCTNLQVGQSLCIPDRSCLRKYKVESGDNCDSIGTSFGVTGSAIMSANPTIDSMCYYLQIGQIICIPDRSCMQKYTVVTGDTCNGIGAGFDVTGSDIISANPTINSGCTNLQVGQILCIPDGSCEEKYTVVSGDTCDSIGTLFGVKGSAIMTDNPTINSECTNLQVGQTLCIPTIDNWESCTTLSTCADNWLCCVAPEDCATQKTTCRPVDTECSSCDGGTSNPPISSITTTPSSSPVSPTPSSHLKVLFITIFTLLGGIIIAIIIAAFFSLSRSRGQDGFQKNHGEGSTTQEEQTTSNPDVPSTVHIHNSDDVSSIGQFTRKTGILSNW